jgi:hypothetical protein
MANTCRRHASSQIAMPPSASAGSGLCWSNRYAPRQREGAEQHRIGKIDRNRILHRAVQAKQHDRARAQQRGAAPPASARLPKFCAQAKNSSRPSMISTYIVTRKSVLRGPWRSVKRDAALFRHKNKLQVPTDTKCKGGLNADLLQLHG